nr:hypothetical protein [uncultured bacterium]
MGGANLCDNTEQLIEAEQGEVASFNGNNHEVSHN